MANMDPDAWSNPRIIPLVGTSDSANGEGSFNDGAIKTYSPPAS